MITKRYTVAMTVTIELEGPQAPTLEEVRDLLAGRVGAFLYPVGMSVLCAEAHTAEEKEHNMLKPMTCCGSMSGHTSICSLVSDNARKPFVLLYPEQRMVSGTQIRSWYRDAVANGQVEDKGAIAAHQAAKLLHEAGLITLRLT
jgi:hypothetical protein